MIKHYKSYFWKDGIPRGTEPLEDIQGENYKIVMDPYRKRISLEAYQGTRFVKVIYDSALVNFRHLKPEEQASWQREVLSESESQVECLVRNQDDRVLYLETHEFEHALCRECRIFSPHGILIATQKIYYKSLGDAFNGVILFDAGLQPVMMKQYAIEDETQEFSVLLSENWDMAASKYEAAIKG